MFVNYLLRGLIIGFSIAAPVGPIGIICIRRTLLYGQKVGFISGLGAATADACYGLVAGLGLTVISTFLVRQQAWLALVGGVFLCYLGVKTLLQKPTASPSNFSGNQSGQPSNQDANVIWAFSSIFFLTLTNPLTILSFAAIFAGLGLSSVNNSSIYSVALIVGVFLGSAAWWLILSLATTFIRARYLQQSPLIRPGDDVSQEHLVVRSQQIFQWINWVSGGLITAFGVAALLRAFGVI